MKYLVSFRTKTWLSSQVKIICVIFTYEKIIVGMAT